MSYYPILTAPECLGVTTVFNYPPNNWEVREKSPKFLNISSSDGAVWRNRTLGLVEYGTSVSITAKSVEQTVGLKPEDTTFFISLSNKKPEPKTSRLPAIDCKRTNFPAWRASLALTSSSGTSVSFQGEIDPFPTPGSLLSFGYCLQTKPDIENFLLFINLEENATEREASLEIRNSLHPSKILLSKKVKNNQISVIPLDFISLTMEDLPLIVCKEMSGIPLYFSRTKDSQCLSLEHTHPPASSVVHGDRRQVQRIMKRFWFSKIYS